MRKLHLVGLTTDRDGMIFTARKGSKSGGYIVPLDDNVLDAVAEARNGHPGAPDVRPEGRAAVDGDRDRRDGRGDSTLTPREMQARLRAGRTIDEVAAEAGVDSGWVARFAVPILAEQAQVVELARGVVYAKPRLGDSAQPLNASVIQNLSDKGVYLPDDLADAGWSAFQLHDSVWMVRFRYRSRGRDQEAQWEIDVPTGRLQARNRHASDLGYVDGGPRRRAPVHDDEGDAADPIETSTGGPARRTRRPAAARTGGHAKARTGSKARPATARTRAAAAPPASTGPTSTKRTSPKAAAARPARKAGKAGKAGKATPAARAVKAPARTASSAKPVAAAKAGPAVRPARKTSGGTRAAKTSAPVKAATGREPARRRPAKSGAGSDVAPAPGTGGVRLAVAQVSAARVAASMASADRAPWAKATRGRSGAGAGQPLATVNGGARPATLRPAAPAPSAPVQAEVRPPAHVVPAFQPRPLPDAVELERPRPRRSAPAPAPRRPAGERPAVILPAPRIPAPEATPLPSGRPVRRRLRSR